MARGPRQLSNDSLSKETYAVLILGNLASRSLPKRALRERLSEPEIYQPFLKLCLEFDPKRKLGHFKKGLLLVVQSIGVVEISRRSRIPRQTLYRMLAPSGNPTLAHLLALLHALKMRFWAVEDDFMARGERFIRPRFLMDALRHDVNADEEESD